MTIIDTIKELPDLIKEYGKYRVSEIDRIYPYKALSLVEDMLDDWKEESLQMLENKERCLKNNYPRKINFGIYKKLGSYWSKKYK